MLELLLIAALVLLVVMIQLVLRLSNDVRTLTTAVKAQLRAPAQPAPSAPPSVAPPPPPIEAPFEHMATRGRCHRCSEEIPSYMQECPYCGASHPIRTATTA